MFNPIKKFFKNNWKKIAVVMLLAGAFYAWSSYKAQQSKPVLQFTNPKKEDISKTLQVSGVVDAKQKARLRFLLGGKITYLGAQEGDWVKKYQTLAKIDSIDLNKKLTQDLNTYFNQRMDFEQSREDYKDKATTTKDERIIQKNQKNLENKVLDVEVRDITIKNNLLSTPIEGILVTSPTAVSGVQLSASDIFEIVDPTSLIILATVDERDLSQVRLGQEATVILDAYPDRKYATTVAKIDYVSQVSSTGTVFLAELPLSHLLGDASNPLDVFRIGMNGDVDILIKKASQVLTVPTNSIKQRSDKNYVSIKKEDGTLEELEIKIGIETDERTEVISGLTDKSEVLVP